MLGACILLAVPMPEVEGLRALCGALTVNSQLARLSLSSSGITGQNLAAMASAGLAGAAGLALLNVSRADGKVGPQQHCSQEHILHAACLLDFGRPFFPGISDDTYVLQSVNAVGNVWLLSSCGHCV